MRVVLQSDDKLTLIGAYNDPAYCELICVLANTNLESTSIHNITNFYVNLKSYFHIMTHLQVKLNV